MSSHNSSLGSNVAFCSRTSRCRHKPDAGPPFPVTLRSQAPEHPQFLNTCKPRPLWSQPDLCPSPASPPVVSKSQPNLFLGGEPSGFNPIGALPVFAYFFRLIKEGKSSQFIEAGPCRHFTVNGTDDGKSASSLDAEDDYWHSPFESIVRYNECNSSFESSHEIPGVKAYASTPKDKIANCNAFEPDRTCYFYCFDCELVALLVCFATLSQKVAELV